MSVTVSTQAELDAALAAGDLPILTGDGEFILPSDRDVVVAVGGSSQPRIVTWGSSQPRIDTWDSSQPRIDTRGSSQLAIRADHPIAITSHGGKTAINRNRNVTVTGNVGYDLEVDDITDPLDWCAYHGLTVDTDGAVVLFKRVNDDWRSDYGTSYRPGETPTAPDWHTRPECGGGLHLSPHPLLTERYSSGPRLVAVRVAAADLVPIPSWETDVADKCKVGSCVVLYECDEDGDPVMVGTEAVL